MGETRKIAAILAADVVGYSRLAATDEASILARLRTLRSDLIDPIISVHNGRVVKRTGDGALVEFRSAVDAVRCAIEVQRAFEERAAERPDERIRVRIGLHTGEAIAEEGDFFGRNVILAARIAAQARGGEILVSEALHEQCGVDEGIAFGETRELELKGLAGTHTVYLAEWQRRGAAMSGV